MCNELENVKSELNDKVTELQQQIKYCEEKNSSSFEKLRLDCEEKDKQIEQKTNFITKLESDCQDLTQQLQKLTDENLRAKQELVTVRTPSKVVEERLVGSSPVDSVLEASDRPDSPQELKKAMAVLKIKNEKMMARLKMFKDKNDKLQIQINELVTVRNRFEDENIRMADHHQRAKDEIHRLSIELRNMDRLWKTESQQLHERLQTFETANDKLVDIKEDLENRLMMEIKLKNDLSEKNEQLDKSVAQLTAELNGLSLNDSARHEQLERKLQSEEEHNKFLESDVKQYQEVIEKLQNDKNKSEIEIKTQTELYQSVVSECSKLKDELEHAKSDLERINGELEVQKIDRQDIQQRFNSTFEDKEILEKRFDDVFQILRSVSQVIPDSSNILSVLKSLIDKITNVLNENDNLKQELQALLVKSVDAERLTERLSVLNEDLLKFESENSHYKDENANITAELGVLVTQNQQLIENLKELEISLIEVGHQKERVEHELANVESKLADIIQARDVVNSEIESLKNENSLLKSSSKRLSPIQSPEQDENLQENNSQISRLEAELQIAIKSLHTKDLRCEELTDEIRQFIDERDSLQIRLSSLMRADQQKELHIQMLEREMSVRPFNESVQFSKMPQDLEVDGAQSINDVVERLANIERQKEELQEVNNILNASLTGERESRLRMEADLKFVEAELESKWKYTPKLKKETKIQINDQETPLLAENSQVIERTYTGATWRIINWLQGRRRFLRRTLRTKHPLQLAWYIYLFMIHVAFLLIVS
ncbi:hypothetical protein CHUAL_010576 [Chamberlinius hualienensis]